MSTLINDLLRAPAEVAQRCRNDDDNRTLSLVSLAAIAIGGAAFGAGIGSFRGGWQILYAGIKIPLAMLLTLAISVPAFHAIAAVLGRPWPLRHVIAVTLAAAARGALLLLAATPALWLAFEVGIGYHRAILATAFAYGLGGLAALGVLGRALGSGSGRIATILSCGFVLALVGAQTSWIMRPYLVRPRTQNLPFMRAREGSFGEALWTSSRSAAGVFRRSHAPLGRSTDFRSAP